MKKTWKWATGGKYRKGITYSAIIMLAVSMVSATRHSTHVEQNAKTISATAPRVSKAQCADAVRLAAVAARRGDAAADATYALIADVLAGTAMESTDVAVAAGKNILAECATR
mgnify:CR=1 FL=1